MIKSLLRQFPFFLKKNYYIHFLIHHKNVAQPVYCCAGYYCSQDATEIHVCPQGMNIILFSQYKSVVENRITTIF